MAPNTLYNDGSLRNLSCWCYKESGRVVKSSGLYGFCIACWKERLEDVIESGSVNRGSCWDGSSSSSQVCNTRMNQKMMNFNEWICVIECKERRSLELLCRWKLKSMLEVQEPGCVSPLISTHGRTIVIERFELAGTYLPPNRGGVDKR
jgi:hypothetical protein